MSDMLARIGVLLIVVAILLPNLPYELGQSMGSAVGLGFVVYGAILALFVAAELSGVRVLRTVEPEENEP